MYFRKGIFQPGFWEFFPVTPMSSSYFSLTPGNWGHEGSGHRGRYRKSATYTSLIPHKLFRWLTAITVIYISLNFRSEFT